VDMMVSRTVALAVCDEQETGGPRTCVEQPQQPMSSASNSDVPAVVPH